MCMRVEFHQRKNGLSAFLAFSMKSSVAFGDFLVDRLHALLVSGPVFSIFCVPSALAQLWITPRGPNFFLNSGSLE